MSAGGETRFLIGFGLALLRKALKGYPEFISGLSGLGIRMKLGEFSWRNTDQR